MTLLEMLTAATLLVLIVYTVETYRLRKAAQAQIEALQKPCLTLVTVARDYDEAVLEMDDAVGGMVLATGNVMVENMGSGPALNVRFEFHALTPTSDVNIGGIDGYLQNIGAGKTFVLQFPSQVLRNAEWEFAATYQSLSDQRYESRIGIKNLVLTKFRFTVGGSDKTQRQSRAAGAIK